MPGRPDDAKFGTRKEHIPHEPLARDQLNYCNLDITVRGSVCPDS